MTVLEDVRSMADTGLADAYDATEDEGAWRVILGELGRRDRKDRADRAAQRLRDEWYDAAHAQRM
jgi:hypothetical protein